MNTKALYSISNIFSPGTRERCVTYLQQIKLPKPKRNPKSTAAVFVPVCLIDHVPSLLYTLRSTDLKNYSGEVSFPGGKTDKNETASQTALRETEEEIGLKPSRIEVWGEGPTVPGRNYEILVTPVIGSVLNLRNEDLKINPQEVSQVLAVPIVKLCDPNNQFYTQFQNGYILPVFIAGDCKIWGLTAYITHIFLSSALSRDFYRNDWMKKKIVLNND